VLTTNGKYSNLLRELTFIRPLRMLSPASFMSTAAGSWKTQNSCPTGWGTISLGAVTITCAGIKNPIGTGPFKYVSRTKAGDDDAEVVFHRHDAYWQGAPGIEILKIKHFATAAAVKQALLDGSLDMVAGAGVLAPADLNAFMTTYSATFNTLMTPVIMHSLIIINSGKAPTTDVALRRAIIHGVDKASIIKKELGGVGEAVDRLFPKSAPYSRVELTPRWDYDYEKATMLNCPPAPPPPILISNPAPPAPPAPAPAPAPKSDDSDKVQLALWLGLGLGIPLLLALGAAAFFFSRHQRSEADLKVALAKQSSPSPTSVGDAAL
jgi:ABC-type transport system substrate-binding protein